MSPSRDRRFTAMAGVVLALTLGGAGASLAAEGDPDPTFTTSTTVAGNGLAVALQPDGKILVGGFLNAVDGTSRNGIARLNTNGSLDTSFNPGTGPDVAAVEAIALQPDGKILIGGAFRTVNGTPRRGIARLNADGSVDGSFAPDAATQIEVSTIAVQGDGKILIGGLNFDLSSSQNIARLNADGSSDGSFKGSTEPFGQVRSIVLQPDSGIIVAGLFGSVDGVTRNSIARLNSDGTLDTAFNPNAAVTSGSVEAVALQPDGRILIGGNFLTATGRHQSARLNADGTLDSSFTLGSFAPGVSAVRGLALQSDGKILIAGLFSIVTSSDGVARLNADGSVDPSFASGTTPNDTAIALALQPNGAVVVVGKFDPSGSGTPATAAVRLGSAGAVDSTFSSNIKAHGSVFALAPQPDGKTVIGGLFDFVNGVRRTALARVNADGTLDGSFDPGAFPFVVGVVAAVVQPDGKILVGEFCSVSCTHITRLMPDGSADASFDPGSGAAGIVRAIALQGDGKIVIGGLFGSFNGTAAANIARLNDNGSVDGSFNASVAGQGFSQVNSVALQPDGSIVLGGFFTTVNGMPRVHVARLTTGGSLDTSFDAGPITGSGEVDAAQVIAVTLQPDGAILLGGTFDEINGVSRNNIARLGPSGALDGTFDPGTGATIASILPRVPQVVALLVQGSGKILVGGSFDEFDGTPRANLARLNPDGTLDTAIPNGTDPFGDIVAIASDAGARPLIGGHFRSVNAALHFGIARLQGATTGNPAGDTYACYRATLASGQPRFAAVTESLKDQFGTGQFDVKSIASICNPADVNGSGVSFPDIHEESLKIVAHKGEPKFVKSTHVTVDRFATRTLTITGPATLLEVTPKALGATPPAPFSSDPTGDVNINRFKCYKATLAKGQSKFVPPPPQTLTDEFYPNGQAVNLTKVTKLCAPVDKNGETPGAEARATHLVCYKAKLPAHSPKFSPQTVSTNSGNFGPHTLVARSISELCVPALKDPP